MNNTYTNLISVAQLLPVRLCVSSDTSHAKKAGMIFPMSSSQYNYNSVAADNCDYYFLEPAYTTDAQEL